MILEIVLGWIVLALLGALVAIWAEGLNKPSNRIVLHQEYVAAVTLICLFVGPFFAVFALVCGLLALAGNTFHGVRRWIDSKRNDMYLTERK